MINREKKNLFVKKGMLTAILFSMATMLLAGCSKGTMSDAKTQKGYSLPEIMIVAMAEKNRYESVCTNEIWGVTIAEDGSNFETYLTEQIKSFMEEMKTMNLLAEDKKVNLTSEERANMAAAADEYYGGLTQEDISHMDISKEDVQNIYEDYYLANKLVEELTKDVNLEVSDSEAKVISIMQAKTDNKEAADSLHQTAVIENADFQKCAESAGIPVTTRQMGREEESKVFEDAAFALLAGQVSEVIPDGDSFYVLKCISDYDEEATTARKEVIYKERKRKAFREIYDEFRINVNLTYSGEPWENLDLEKGEYAKDADFFGIYKKYLIQ